jgi:hypothetical protein
MSTTRRSFLTTSAAALAAVGTTLAAKPRATNTRATRAGRARIDASKAVTNGDEELYTRFTKGLPHDARGEVDPAAYQKMIDALQSADPAAFDAIPMGGDLKLVNPQAAFCSGLEGPDGLAVAVPPPPGFRSAEQAAEAVELYWEALTRDVPFARYESDPLIARAADDLSKLPAYAGSVTPATIFRGPTPGDNVGPFVSQFLWKEVPWGAIRLVQHVRTSTPEIDYLRTFDDWLAAQNGKATTSKHAAAYRYIRSGRDLAAYAQLDFPHQAYETACLILFGMQGTTDAQRPYKGAPYDAGNPYRGNRTQSGFVTFGAAQALDLVARVTIPALRTCWAQKWLVHRRLRPEEYGGRVHLKMTGVADYPIHESVLGSAALAAVRDANGTFLLPHAYPEAAPLHPSYPSGHAAIAGACTTVLKAFFDESFPIDDPVDVTPDGLTLMPYRGPQLTVGGELNKLAWNIACGRDMSGIHWRSDAVGGLRLGEAVALSILGDMKECFNERFHGFSLTTFDGKAITV